MILTYAIAAKRFTYTGIIFDSRYLFLDLRKAYASVTETLEKLKLE